MVLDLLLEREPHSRLASRLFAHVERGTASGYICATSITTIYYLATKSRGREAARAEIERLVRILEVAPVNRAGLEAALEPGFKDFEDGVVHEAARNVNVDAIVTRNVADFRSALTTVYTPAEMLTILDQQAS